MALFCYSISMDLKTVDYLAELSRMDILEGEKAGFLKDLQSIIVFIDQIQHVKVDASLGQNNREINVFRDDVVAPLAPAYDLIEVAPDHQDHFVRVPKVIE